MVLEVTNPAHNADLEVLPYVPLGVWFENFSR